MKERVSVQDRAKAPPNKRARAVSGAPATDGGSRSLWFNAPMNDQDRRPQLTRQRVVEEALAVIAHDGANALTMRRLATRLGIDRLIGVGESGRVMVNAARMEGMWPEEAEAVADPDAALALLTPVLGPADVILVKASRVVALDRVADALLQPRAGGA